MINMLVSKWGEIRPITKYEIKNRIVQVLHVNRTLLGNIAGSPYPCPIYIGYIPGFDVH